MRDLRMLSQMLKPLAITEMAAAMTDPGEDATPLLTTFPAQREISAPRQPYLQPPHPSGLNRHQRRAAARRAR